MVVGTCNIPNGTKVYPGDFIVGTGAGGGNERIVAMAAYNEGDQVWNYHILPDSIVGDPASATVVGSTPGTLPAYNYGYAYVGYTHKSGSINMVATGWRFPYGFDPVADGKGHVTITVIDTNTGLPISGATISGTVGDGTTNASGIFTSYYHDNGSTYSYYAAVAHYLTTAVYNTPSLSGDYAVTLQMSPDPLDPPVDPPVDPPYDPTKQAIVTVHVVDANSPSVDLAGASVTLNGSTVTADSTGRSKFVVLLGYQYTYSAAKTNYTTSAPATTATITGNTAYAVLLSPGANAPPVCDFTGTPLYGKVPLSVQFTDKSVNTPTSWLWSFGDGITTGNTLQNPLHVYISEGTYTVTLTATNANGSSSKTRTAYILVSEKIGVLQPNQKVMIMRDVQGKMFCVPVTSLQ